MVTKTSFKFKQKRSLLNSQASFKNSLSSDPLELSNYPIQPQPGSNDPRSVFDKFDIHANEPPIPRQTMFQLSKTIMLNVLPWVAISSGYGFFVFLLGYHGLLPEIVYSEAMANTIVSLGIALGLALTLKANTAYRRFRSGRKLLSTTVDVIHNTVRGIWLYVKEQEPQERYEKESAMQLASAFAVAMKLHLSQQPMDELKPLVSQLEYQRLEVSHHAPLDITLWIGDYLEHQHEQKHVDMFQLSYLRSCLNEMVNIAGDCEQVLKMPTPLINSHYLKVFSISYLIMFPLGAFSGFGWMTWFAMALVSFICLTLNQTIAEINNPFGNNHSCLYLDNICDTIKGDVDYLMQQTYCSQPKIVINLPKKTA